MASLPFSAQADRPKVLPGYIKSSKRGLFTIPPTSSINWIPIRKLVYLVSLGINHALDIRLPLSESCLVRNDDSTKDQISFFSQETVLLRRRLIVSSPMIWVHGTPNKATPRGLCQRTQHVSFWKPCVWKQNINPPPVNPSANKSWFERQRARVHLQHTK